MNSQQEFVEGSSTSTDFAQQVYQKADSSYRVTQEVLRWAGDQPFLCELVRSLILEHPYPFPSGQEGLIVQQIVQAKIIQDWENNTAADHLKTVLQSILDDPQRNAILNLYLHALQGDFVFTDNSLEQEKLLNSGLVSIENGELKISNAIYASVFNLESIQQYRTGSSQSTGSVSENKQTSHTTRLWSGVALFSLLVAIGAYPLLKKSAIKQREAVSPLSTQTSQQTSLLANPDIPPPTPTEVIAHPASSDAVKSLAARVLFDNGIEHGKSGRWLPMLREFCSVPADSSYFPLVEQRLTQWSNLFEEDLQLALKTFREEENGSCSVAEAIL